MTEQMTIEKLAQMTQEEFVAVRAEMREGFKIMDDRFFALLNRMDAGFSTMNMRFEELDEKIDSLRLLPVRRD